ncbi:MAG TPA: phosphoribosylglycinamide formyltransferase [Tepidisphaeraceae bacterium]|jgi:formyltetrahydrofolate-dependent phosphoribosylglycinamide formyltransferase
MISRPINLAVLVSGGGTTLQNLIDAVADGRLRAKIVLVIASRPGIGGIARAEAAGLPVAVVERKKFDSLEAFSDAVFDACTAADVDLVCLGGWLQLLRLPDAWAGRVMNIHPAILPAYGGRGMFGRHVHAAVLAAGERVSGCTVHWVNNEYDAGPIIVQRTCPVLPGDTPETLAARVFELEKSAYVDAIAAYIADRV